MPSWLPPVSLWVGIASGSAGVISGLAKILHRVVTDCPNGKTWGVNEKDFTCYSHPELGNGVAIVAGSLMGALLVILVACLASEIMRGSTNDTLHRPN